MKKIKYIYWKSIYLYHKIILRIFYNRKPNKDGTFDIMSSPSFSDAKLKLEDVLVKNEDYVCPSCGTGDYTFNLTSKIKIYYTCKCGWKGECLILIGEWKNKTRTELIDKMLK